MRHSAQCRRPTQPHKHQGHVWQQNSTLKDMCWQTCIWMQDGGDSLVLRYRATGVLQLVMCWQIQVWSNERNCAFFSKTDLFLQNFLLVRYCTRNLLLYFITLKKCCWACLLSVAVSVSLSVGTVGPHFWYRLKYLSIKYGMHCHEIWCRHKQRQDNDSS